MKKYLILILIAISSSLEASVFIEYANNTSDQALRGKIQHHYYAGDTCILDPYTGQCADESDGGFGGTPIYETDDWYFINDGLSHLIKYQASIQSGFVVINRVGLNADDLALSQEAKALRQEFKDNGLLFANWWLDYQNLSTGELSAKVSEGCQAQGIRESIDSAFDYFANPTEAGRIAQNLVDWYTPPGFLDRVSSLSHSGIGWAMAGNSLEVVTFGDGGSITFGLEPIGNGVASYVILGESHAADGSLLSSFFDQVGNKIDKSFRLKQNVSRTYTDECMQEELEALLQAQGVPVHFIDFTEGFETGDTCVIYDDLNVSYRVFSQTSTTVPDGNGGYIITTTGAWTTIDNSFGTSQTCP